MELRKMQTTLLKPIPRINNIIPINEVTLLTALPGCGKSYTLLKFLNLAGIKPILFNLDEDHALQQFSTYQFGKEFIKPIFNDEVTDLKDQVIIIDTYIRLMDVLDMATNTVSQQQYVSNTLEHIAHANQCTVIIIGHPADYVGRSSIFNDNPYLVRNCMEHIHIDKIVSTKKHAQPEYRLYINKGRGIGGSTIHEDFLRTPTVNPLTGKTI